MRQVENFLFFWALWPCQKPITELSKSKKEKISIRDLLGTDDLTIYGTGGVPRQRCIIRIYGISAGDFSERLPPTQARGTPDCHSKTLVAQMPFASELPLSQGNHSINIDGQKMIIQGNPRLAREK